MKPVSIEISNVVSKRKIPTVMKFGGTSVQNAEAFARVAEIVGSQQNFSPVVVTSAMSKVTDALLAAFETAKKGDFESAFASLKPHFERHEQVSKDLTGKIQQKAFQTELKYAERELSDLLMRVSRRSLPLSMLKDAIVSYGEQLSSRLLAEVCKAKNRPVTDRFFFNFIFLIGLRKLFASAASTAGAAASASTA